MIVKISPEIWERVDALQDEIDKHCATLETLHYQQERTARPSVDTMLDFLKSFKSL